MCAEYVQFQEGKIGIAVVGPIFTLLRNVVLENNRRSWIIPIQSIEDLVDVWGSVRRIIKWWTHGGEISLAI